MGYCFCDYYYVCFQGNYTRGFSVVGLKLTFVNRYSKYLWVYYLPTSMFTVTSWVSFILPPTSYPARTSLLVTVFLCQIGLFNAVIRDTPNQDGGNHNEEQEFKNLNYNQQG